MTRIILISFALFVCGELAAQPDTLDDYIKKNAIAVDTLRLKVKEIVFTGNEHTRDYIMLREMRLKKGSRFTLKKYTKDIMSIYNLGLFTRVDILPVPVTAKEVVLNVDVQERWFILPLPIAGMDDGEWKKIWFGMNIRWDNFRGRNESLSLRFRIFYNPAVSFSYSIPWIGEKLHLFTSYSVGYSKTRNQSLTAIGRPNEGNTITYDETNYDNINFNTNAQVGKYLSRLFSVYTVLGFNYTRTTEWAPGRTLNPDGKDKFLSLGFGLGFDSRDIREYATKGYYGQGSYTRYKDIEMRNGYGRFTLESQSFIPLHLTNKYYLTAATRIYTSMAIGSDIPVYDHQYLGYGDNFVRGWRGIAYEGEGEITMFNELRIPVLSPRYIKAKELPIAKHLPVIKNLDLRYGVFITLLYDVGTVFNHDENIFGKKFQAGTGIGVILIAPFGYALRADWAVRLSKPAIGQLVLNLYAKF